jgi:hypothetical protein
LPQQPPCPDNTTQNKTTLVISKKKKIGKRVDRLSAFSLSPVMSSPRILIEARPVTTEGIPQCTYCRKPTGNFCDGRRCDESGEIRTPMCNECEGRNGLCRLCIDSGLGRYIISDDAQLYTVLYDLEACARCHLPQPGFRCGKCHLARYCSRDCQKEDWNRHKVLTCTGRRRYPDRLYNLALGIGVEPPPHVFVPLTK